MNTTSSKTMSQANFLKFYAESISRTGNTPYLYWSVFDSGTLWGVWRIRWQGATYSTWVSGHGSQGYTGSGTAPSGTPYSDVWKTGSGTTGVGSGSYTISNNTSLDRAVLPDMYYSGGSSSRGIHYKRTTSGEHYPWRNNSYVMNTNGYFYPSSSYSMGTDTRYDHYIYIADS